MTAPNPTATCPPQEPRKAVASGPATASILLPRFIKAEANLLRLPLFALGTKGLRNLDAIECRGTMRRHGETHEFTFQAARNTKTHYPGPLSRAAHLAFLSIATDRGFPIENPIVWSWRDLCRRMGIRASGRTVAHLKAAVVATAGLLIRSQYALYSKTDREPIRTGDDALHLYDRVTFVGSPLPDGTIADANYLWLSEWYLQNLNAFHTAPLDYELWRFLDRQSPIASRLYEWLLLNFYSGVPELRINYETLAQYLPVRPEHYLSLATKQLEPAFKLLRSVDAVSSATFLASKSGIAMLAIARGKSLTPPLPQPPLALNMAHDPMTDEIEVRELRHASPAEHELVREFHRLWSGSDQRPSAKEQSLAKELIDRYGEARAKAVIREAVKLLRAAWPDAKSFGAIRKYLDAARREVEKDEHRSDTERKLADAERREHEEQKRRETEILRWKPDWDALPETEREKFREAVSLKNPHVARFPKLIERFSLTEFALRRGVNFAPLPEGR